MGRRTDARGGLEADERGATQLELLILLGMLLLVGMGAWRALGDTVRGVAEQQAACVEALDGSGCKPPQGADEEPVEAEQAPPDEDEGAAADEGAEGDPAEPGMTRALAALLVTALCVDAGCVGLGDADGQAPPPALPPAPMGPLFAQAPEPPPQEGDLQAAQRTVMRRAFVASPADANLRAALAHHLLEGPPADPQTAVAAAVALVARAHEGDERALEALARATGRADLAQSGVADHASYALLDAAIGGGQAGPVVDALLAALQQGGGRDRGQTLATLGWAARGLEAGDARVASVHEALRAGLARGGDEADSAVQGFEALFDRLLPEDVAALGARPTPDTVKVLAAAEAHERQRRELRARLETKLRAGQTLSYDELRSWMAFADTQTAQLIARYLASARGGARLSAADQARLDGWEAFPFDPAAAGAMARMLQGEPLDAAQDRALFDGMKARAAALRALEREYPRFGVREMPPEVASARFLSTFALDCYLRWRGPRDAARMEAIEGRRILGDTNDARAALGEWAALTQDLIDLLVDPEAITRATAARDRGIRDRGADVRDRRFDDGWNETVGREATQVHGLVAVRVLDLDARLRRQQATLDADTRAGRDTTQARVTAAADLQRRLDAARADIRRGLEYLRPRLRDMNRVGGLVAVRGAIAALEAAEERLVRRIQPAIDALKARPTTEIFRGWGVHPSEANRLAALADARYGPQTVALVASRVRMANTLPPALRQELVGSPGEIDPIQVAQQLATGTLDHRESRTRALLDPLERRLADLRAAETARIAELRRDVVSRTGNRDVFAGGVAGNTRGGLPFWAWVGSLGGAADDWERSEGRSVDLLRRQEGFITDAFARLQAASGRQLFFDLADDLARWQRARDAGRQREADLALYEVWRKHGDAVAQIDAALLPELRDAWRRLHQAGVFATPQLPELGARDAAARRTEALALLRGLDPMRSDTAGVRAYALATLDRDPHVAQLQRVAGEAAGRLQTMMRLLGAAQQGTKYQPLVDYVREDLARPLLALFDAAETRQAIASSRELLAALRAERARLPATDTAGRRELDQRIAGLDAMVRLADNAGVREALRVIMDKSKFNADTVGNWLRYEGPKVLGAIAVATVAAVTIVATGGGAAPLWAIALGASVGGYVGYQATSESMYQLRNTFDPDVTSGRVRWGDRSTVGAYVNGDQVYDPVRNEHVPMGFGRHVLLPAVREIAVGFAINFATMGLGRLGSGYINSALARAGGQNAMLRQAARLRAVDARMANMARATANNPAADAMRRRLLAEIGRNFPREFLDEVKDEAVEAGLERVLGAVDQRLAPLAALLNATGKGVRLDHGGRAEAIRNVVDNLRVEGFEVDTTLVDGRIRARMNGIELFIDGRGEVTMAEARGPPAQQQVGGADAQRQGAIRNPADPVGEVANEYDLTPAETELLRQLYGDLEAVTRRIETDPVAAARDLHRLTGDARWSDRVPFRITPALEITGHELDTLRTQAREYAEQLRGEMTEAEILDHLVREKFTGILRANAGPGGTYNRHPVTGVVSIPAALQVRRDGQTRALDASDPVEGALARLHARALVEELTHGAGFTVRPGSYVPLSPRMADFQHWLRQPRTQEWLRQTFDAAAIARMESMIFEADAMDLFVRHSTYTDSEIDRYDVRRAFQRFLDEGAPGAPPGTRTTPPVDGSLQGAISWWSRWLGGGRAPARTDVDPARRETPPPVDAPPARRLGPDGRPEPTAFDAQGKEVGPDWYGTVYYGSSTETPERLTPERVFESGLGGRGTDRDLRRHVEAMGNSAFRGTTLLPMTPDGETGASLWAGPGGYVYEINGVAGWDANRHLERIPVSGGITRQNAVRGENEVSILAEVPRERIKAAYQIIETPTGRLRLGPAIPNPNYRPLVAPGGEGPQVQGAIDAQRAGRLRGAVDELVRGRAPRDLPAAELRNVQALALDTVERLFTNQFGTDTALLEAVRGKKPAFVRHGADPAAWGGRDTAAQQRAALLVVLHTFQGTDAGDVALRKAALDKLAEVGRPGDVTALLAMVRNPRTSTDLHHGLEAIKAITARHGSPQVRGDAEVQRRVGHLLGKATLTDAERAQVIEAVLQHGEIASIKQHKGKNMNEVYFVTFAQTVVGADGKPITIRGVFKPENTYPGKDKSFFGREVSAYLFDRDFAGSGRVPPTVEVVLGAAQAPRGGPAPVGTGSMQYMIPDARALGPSATEIAPEYAFLVDERARSELPAAVQADMRQQLAEIRTLLFVLNDPDKLPDSGGFRTPNYGNVMVAADPQRPGFYRLYMIDNGGGQGALDKTISPEMLPPEVPAALRRRLGQADADQVERTVAPWAGDAGGDVSRRLRRAVPAAPRGPPAPPR